MVSSTHYLLAECTKYYLGHQHSNIIMSTMNRNYIVTDHLFQTGGEICFQIEFSNFSFSIALSGRCRCGCSLLEASRFQRRILSFLQYSGAHIIKSPYDSVYDVICLYEIVGTIVLEIEDHKALTQLYNCTYTVMFIKMTTLRVHR